MNKATILAVSIVSGLALTTAAEARDQIRVVGSSTVYPFTTAVAEQFGKAGNKTPIVESTGTGGGFKIFCEGVGVDKADATNASRRIKKGEFELCQKNGVTEIIEMKVGVDGLTMAQSKAGTPMALTFKQVFQAMAAQVPDKDGKLVDNPNKMWSDIDPALPNVKIEILGPPPTSGTRDSFMELYMETGAEGFDSLKAMMKDDKANKTKNFDKVWKTVRTDGAFIEAGENDAIIVQKLEANKDAVGIFGFSNLDQNSAKLSGITIEGVVPTYETVSGGSFKGARPLFFYVKKQHIGVIPGLDKFLAEYMSEKALGAEGYLTEKGLVAMPKDKFAEQLKAGSALTPMTADGL